MSFRVTGHLQHHQQPSEAAELLGLLANGWSNRRIAEACFLSLHTVRTHVQSILVKLGVHSKLEAVAFAYQHRLVPIGDRDVWGRHSA